MSVAARNGPPITRSGALIPSTYIESTAGHSSDKRLNSYHTDFEGQTLRSLLFSLCKISQEEPISGNILDGIYSSHQGTVPDSRLPSYAETSPRFILHMTRMQKITPCLWFNDNAEEAIRFYTSVFKDSSIGPFIRYDAASAEVSGRPEGSFLSGTFTLSGQEFMVLNGGPEFPFTEAISLVVNCADQKEVDYYWDKLTEGGTEVQCGWLKDKFGVSWQVVPTILDEMLCDPDAAKAARVMEAMLKMIKIDIAELKRAYEG